MHFVHKDLGPGLPEYVYQEALMVHLKNEGYAPEREYRYHPLFQGNPLESYVRLDMMIPCQRGNIIVECKSIDNLTDRERYQVYGYLRATQFPIAILVNFGSWPKAQIERYYFDRERQTIYAF